MMIRKRKRIKGAVGKFAAFVLAVAMAATSLPYVSMRVQAAEFTEEISEETLEESGIMDEAGFHSLSGACGENITYSLEQGVLTLTGFGDMNNFYVETPDSEYDYIFYPGTNAPWSIYAEEITHIVLDDRITSVGDSAFMGLIALTGEVRLPSSLNTVGKFAFQGCEAASRKLTLPETLTSVGEFAFDGFSLGCSDEYGLEISLVLPQSLKEIGEFAFQGYSVQKVYVFNPTMKFGQYCIGDEYSAFYGAEDSTAEQYARENRYQFFVWTAEQNTYTVTFDSNGGSAVEAQKIEVGSTVAMPAQPVREGWYFMGWYLDGRQFDFDTAPNGNITLTARWSDVPPSSLAPVLFMKNIGSYADELVLTWERSFDEKLKGYEIYRAVGADGEYGKIGSTEASAVSYIDDVGLCYERSQYHYKIQGVYEGDERTPFSNVVSTEGMIYNGLQDWDENCVRAEITDEQGNPIDSLTLHVGESSPELRVRLIYKDGSSEDWKSVVCSLEQNGYEFYCNEWRVSEGGFSPVFNDGTYARFLPTFDYLGIDSNASGASAQLVGIAPTPIDTSYYVSVTLRGCTGGIAIPLTVLEAEPGVDYGETQGLVTHDNINDFWEEVRVSFRNRKESFCILLDYDIYEKTYGEEGGEVPEFFELLDEEAFDFYEDRPGMKSGEGDYLQEAISQGGCSTRTISYYGDYYAAIIMNDVGYFSTKEQEDWMDEQVDKMVNRSDGIFYSYRDKSDYEKIKAVYEYVADRITWVDGTNVGLYHTAYSGLHDGKGTCQSYALLFYRLIREMGISSKVLMGTDAGAHTYNIVELGGQYYYIDCSDRRFLKGSKKFKASALQDMWQDPRFVQNFMNKISKEDYSESGESGDSGESSESNEGLIVCFVDDAGRTVEPENYEATYNDVAIKPIVCVKHDGVILTEGVDYTVKYKNNINAGNKAAIVTVNGKGNFTGASEAINFTINPAVLGTDVSVPKAMTVAVNTKIAPVLMCGARKLGAKDFEMSVGEADKAKYDSAKSKFTETGNFTLTVTAKGTNYTGEDKIEVNVVEKTAIKKLKVTIDSQKAKSIIYDGNEHDPEKLIKEGIITVSDATTKTELMPESDGVDNYKIVCGSDTVNAGTVKFTIVGCGEYGGSVAKSYKINPVKNSDGFTITPKGEKKAEYKSSGARLDDGYEDGFFDITYKSGDKTLDLKQGTDYKVAYSSNKKVGTGKYTITFLGNYKGSKPADAKSTFEITPVKVYGGSDKNYDVVIPDKAYDKAGKAYKSAPIVTVNGEVVKSSNYTVEYKWASASDADDDTRYNNDNNKVKVTLAGEDTYAKVKVTVTFKPNANYVKATDDGTDSKVANTIEEEYFVREVSGAVDLSKAKITFYSDEKCTKQLKSLEYNGCGFYTPGEANSSDAADMEKAQKVYVKVEVKGVDSQKLKETYTVHWTNSTAKGKATVVINGTGEANADGTTAVGGKNASISIKAKKLK